MGGCTITRLAESLDHLFSDIEKQIIAAASCGLYPDSELVVIEPNAKVAKLFRTTVKYNDTPFYSAPVGVDFAEVKEGRAFHVGVAGRYGPEPEEGQLVGTIHVHS